MNEGAGKPQILLILKDDFAAWLGPLGDESPKREMAKPDLEEATWLGFKN